MTSPDFPSSLNAQELIFLLILLTAFGLLISEKLRNDIVAVLIILALGVTRVLKPSEALSGFGSEPAIIVASIFVMSGALHQTQLAETIGSGIGRMAGTSYVRMLSVIMPGVALLSAFTHHVTTTAVMLPVTLDLCRQRNIPPSKLLLPLSFAASLGTSITIIGAPAFLIASQILQQAGRPGLGIFSIAPIGLSLSLVGTLFMVVVGRYLLPVRPGDVDLSTRFRLDNYFTELTILPDSPFLEKTLEEVKADKHFQFTVVGWMREGRRLRGPFGEHRLCAGDVLLVHTTPEDIVTFRQEQGIELHPVTQYGASVNSSDPASEISDQLVQAVIAPNSDIIGRSLREIDFRSRYGPIVVGLWRRGGFLQKELAHIKLRSGDVLVLQGDAKSLANVEKDPAFLMLVPFHGEPRLRRKARLAAGTMLATVVLAASNLVAIEMATLAGAVAMMLFGCVTPRQAYRAVDARIYIFIAGAVPLGIAMQRSGTSRLLAGWLQQAVGGWSETAILLVLFVTVGVVTQFMSDAATTALFAPVAVALAQALGHRPEAFVVTVAMASVAAFLTPIGHHGNLLVYGPGGYQFSDFMRVGGPLTVLLALVVTTLAPIIWPG